MDKSKSCECCGSPFEQKQEHQKFCSTKCRTENHYRKKYGISEPFKTLNNGNTTESISDERTRLKTPINAEFGMFDRLLDERESRMADKIKLAQAEMKIEMLEKELENAQSLASMAKEFAPVIAGIFSNPGK